MIPETAGDHDIWELLKLQDEQAWALVWEKVVLTEAKSYRSGQLARRRGVTPEELMSMLYVEMVGARKLELYRDDGGSLWGWMRTYVRGYVRRSSPAEKREISLDTTGLDGLGDETGGSTFEEKVSKIVSDAKGRDTLPDEDPAVRRREEWELVQKCFGDLWAKNPLRAYVHLLRLRMNLSSAEIKSMLGISSEANVDQLFSRAVKDMRELKVEHENGACS
ncbi:MAG: hypothetical protein ACI4Q3_06200 [Kiritimatiellia bacterium]